MLQVTGTDMEEKQLKISWLTKMLLFQDDFTTISFFEAMSPTGGLPTGELLEAIESDFGQRY
jgi:superoxide dismutase